MDYVQTVLQPLLDNWQIFAVGFALAVGFIRFGMKDK